MQLFVAFPIFWLSAGAQITHGGQVQRPRENKRQQTFNIPVGDLH